MNMAISNVNFLFRLDCRPAKTILVYHQTQLVYVCKGQICKDKLHHMQIDLVMHLIAPEKSLPILAISAGTVFLN